MAVCADRKAGQYGRLGGLTWRRWHFWGVKADLRSPEPDQRHHVPICRRRRERQGATFDQPKRVDLSGLCLVDRVYDPDHRFSVYAVDAGLPSRLSLRSTVVDRESTR